MRISTLVRKASRLLFSPNEKNGSFRLPKLLEFGLWAVVFLELLAPLFSTSYGLDARHHLNWINQFIELISEGVLIPRWVPGGFWGFGAASFYFYPPVTFYLAALVSALTTITSATTLFQILSLLGTLGSFFAAQALLRSIGAKGYQMTLGAILYTIAPFRIVELYHRGALPTHLAYVFIPLVWLGLVAIVRREGCIYRNTSRLMRILFLGVSSSMLALTSVPVTLVTIICICVAALVVWKELRRDTILDIALAAGIAAALTAFHFAAVISARPYTRLDEIVGFHTKLVWSQLLHGINWLYVYHLVFVYLPVVIIYVAYWKIRTSENDRLNSERIAARIGLALLIVIVFLDVPPLSRMLWNGFIPLQLVQFPMRFYSQLLLFVGVITGLAQSEAMKRAAVASAWIVALGALAPAILVVFNIHIFNHFTGPPEDSPEYRPIYTVGIETFWQTMPPHKDDPPAMIANSQLRENIHRLSISPSDEEFEVALDGPRTVTFHRFFWPYWHLYMEDRISTLDDRSYTNSKEIISRPDSIGRAIAVLPSGDYNIRWQLVKTPLELAGLWVSGVSWGLLLALSGIGFVLRGVKRKRPIT